MVLTLLSGIFEQILCLLAVFSSNNSHGSRNRELIFFGVSSRLIVIFATITEISSQNLFPENNFLKKCVLYLFKIQNPTYRN